jgi:integrase/recombinase XerD
MKQARVPTDAEFKRLLAMIQHGRHAARNRLAVMLSYYAGLRVGEIAALTIADVYDAQSQPRDQIVLRKEITKTNEARTIYVNERLGRELDRYCLTLSEETAKPARPLLLTQKRTAFSANTLCQLFAQLYREAGVDGASSHSGRRWFITKLAHSGTSPKVIMTLAGHKNLSTTQRYIDVSPAMMRAAVEVL